MKKLLTSLLLAIGLILLTTDVKASHFAGSDLTYTCIGGNDYIINFTFYRDCSGAGQPTSVQIVFNCSSNSQFNFNVTLNQKSGPNGLEVTPGCNAVPTRCVSSSGGYGLREWVYQGQVTLPPCNFWTMSFSSCCRNPSNTIQSSSSQSFYVESKLNNLQAPCNSSPTFTNKPVTVMCSGQTFCFNHGALDPDGDSLSYEWTLPKTSASGTVTYIGGYSYTQPLPSIPPVSLNAVTGDICMTPTMNIVSPMAVLVKEWRKINGVITMIGSMIRDMQVNVITCNNTLPQLSGMDTLLTHTYNVNDTMYFWEVCLGQQISFDMNGYDADVYNPSVLGHPEIMNITWNNGIPAGTFQTYYNGTDSAYANFSWTPTSANVSNIPHCFTVTVRDDACPYNGSQTFSYCIQVRGMEVTIGSDTTLCQGESLHIIALADSTTVNYIWKLNGTPTGTPLYDSTYTFNTSTLSPGLYMIGVETNDGGTTTKCPGLDEIKVRVVYQPNVNLGNDTMVCEGETVTLDAGQGQTYLWSTGAQTQTITVSSPPGGVFHVTVDGGNGSRCVDSDTMRVEIVEMPVVDLGPDICSKTDGVVIKAGNSGFTYNWNTGASSDSLIINTSGVYSVTVTKVPGSGCEKTDDIVVNIIDFDLGSDIELCEHQSQKLEGPLAPSGHTYAYIWDVDGSQVSTNPYYVISLLPEGSHTINLDVGGGCLGSVNVEIIKCPLTIPNIITPNSDGHNDEFFIENLHYYPNSTIIIYNRWGKKVYESSNYQSDWDAANNSDGVYYWVLKINDGDGTELHGTVTVMRK